MREDWFILQETIIYVYNMTGKLFTPDNIRKWATKGRLSKLKRLVKLKRVHSYPFVTRKKFVDEFLQKIGGYNDSSHNL